MVMMAGVSFDRKMCRACFYALGPSSIPSPLLYVTKTYKRRSLMHTWLQQSSLLWPECIDPPLTLSGMQVHILIP